MEKELFSRDADEFSDMSLAEAIAWLQGLAEGQPVGADEITFSIYQRGDHYDGYGCAEIKVYRDATPEEEAATRAEWAENDRQQKLKREADERRALAALKAKYEG